MDKTVAISLGGYAFTLDASAYQTLKSYLQNIRTSLGDTDGLDEIIGDIETRIAELLQKSLNSREVVNEADINTVMNVMGTPEQYSDNDDLYQDQEPKQSVYKASGHKKLFRNPDEAWIGGVCAGIGEYFNTNPLWIRAIFVAPIFFTPIFDFFGISFGFFFLTYIVLGLIVPEAKTTSQKLQMQGKPINVDSIKEFTEKTASNVSEAASKASPLAGKALETIGKVLLIFIGIVLLFKAIGWIVGGLGLVFGSIFGFFTFSEYIGYVFNSTWVPVLGANLLAILLIIPGIMLAMFAFRLFSERFKLRSRNFIVMGVIWFIALIGAAVLGGTFGSQFINQNSTTESKIINLDSDTVQLSLNQYEHENGRKSNNDIGLFQKNGLIYTTNVDYKVYESDSDQIKIEVEYESQGRTSEQALENSNAINYQYKVEGNKIVFDEFFSLDKDTKFRGQRVDVYIYIPKNKVFYVKDFYDLRIKKYNGHDDWDLDNRYFQYQNNQAICLSCNQSNQNQEDSVLDENGDLDLDIKINDEKANIQINEKGIRISTEEEDKVIITEDSVKINSQ